MNYFSVIKETLIQAGTRISKVNIFGAKTADNIAPFGDDSCPLPDMIALYAETGERGENVVIGYINKNQIAAIGEKRIFSLKSDGSLSFAIHLKNDETCEIGGNTDFMVRFNELKSGFDQLKTDFNNLVTAYNSHIHTTTATVGSSPTPGVISATTSVGSNSNASIDASKIDNIKTA